MNLTRVTFPWEFWHKREHSESKVDAKFAMAMASVMTRSTTSRITADFKHLAITKGPSGVFKAQARKLNPLVAKPTDAHPGDRIKWWNIVPGDRVRIIRGPYKDSSRIVEVLSVNKYRNLVMFKDLSVRF